MQRIPAAGSLDAPVLAFDSLHGAPAGREPAPRQQAGDVRPGADYLVALATDRAADPAFCLRWRALVVAGNSHQKIYQTPEFFQFQRETCQGGERLELLTVSRRSDASLVGVLPVRIGRQEIVFGIGKLVLYKTEVEVINLLGSVPVAPGGAALTQFIVLQLLAAFPHAKAVFMQALPLFSEYWRSLTENGGACQLGTALMGQRRECHTLPLPATFDQYLDKFSAKKRYNLNRQIRQLGEQAGALALQRVACVADVGGMMAALMALVPAARLASMLRPATFEALARRGLLLCYVLRAGDEVVAAVIGTRSPDTWHIHNIFVNKRYLSFSIGTTALHLAIKDLMAERCFGMIDFGFGTPNHDFRSSHVLDLRAQVLLFDRSRPARLLFRAHALFTAVAEGALARVKALRKALRRGPVPCSHP